MPVYFISAVPDFFLGVISCLAGGALHSARPRCDRTLKIISSAFRETGGCDVLECQAHEHGVLVLFFRLLQMSGYTIPDFFLGVFGCLAGSALHAARHLARSLSLSRYFHIRDFEPLIEGTWCSGITPA